MFSGPRAKLLLQLLPPLLFLLVLLLVVLVTLPSLLLPSLLERSALLFALLLGLSPNALPRVSVGHAAALVEAIDANDITAKAAAVRQRLSMLVAGSLKECVRGWFLGDALICLVFLEDKVVKQCLPLQYS